MLQLWTERANDCPLKEQGIRCYKCNQFRHISPDCMFNPAGEKREADQRFCTNLIKSGTSMRCEGDIKKEVSINGLKLNALIDTSSELNLIKTSLYARVSDGVQFYGLQIAA